MKKVLLEAPVFNIESAILAASYGVNRIELCSSYLTGGETPSMGALRFLKEKISVPIFVMIRPRGDDFIYSTEEIEVMKEDIRLCKSNGADGFVFGALTREGNLDLTSNEELIACAEGLPCTLHRAFDSTPDIYESLEEAISIGFKRILTSGGKNTVSDGMENLLLLLQKAGERIIILPGGGLQPDHLSELNNSGHLKEIHASCKGWRRSEANFSKQGLDLTRSEKIITIDKAAVRDFQKHLEMLL